MNTEQLKWREEKLQAVFFRYLKCKDEMKQWLWDQLYESGLPSCSDVVVTQVVWQLLDWLYGKDAPPRYEVQAVIASIGWKDPRPPLPNPLLNALAFVPVPTLRKEFRRTCYAEKIEELALGLCPTFPHGPSPESSTTTNAAATPSGSTIARQQGPAGGSKKAE